MSDKSRNYFKWFVIGCLGALGILAMTFIFLIWRFTPLVSVNDANGKVQLLGGMISVDDSSFSYSSTGSSQTSWIDHDGPTLAIEGDYIPLNNEENLQILFSGIKADITWHDSKEIHWKCKLNSKKKASLIESQGSSLVLYLKSAKECEITVPKELFVHVRAKAGKVHLEQPTNEYEVELSSGMVSVKPKAQLPFNYDLRVNHGSISHFDEQPPASGTLSAKIRVNSGSIRQL